MGTLGFAAAVIAFVCAPQEPAKPTPERGRDLPPFLEDFKDNQGWELRPFLEDFLDTAKEAPLVAADVAFRSAFGPVRGYWVRPETKERLPAVLLVYDRDEWSSWMKENARHMSGIGYGVLLVDVQPRRVAAARIADPQGAFTDEATLAELSAAVRWLRGRPDLLPDRLGVVGWGWSGGQALALAAATSLQACICCDSPVPEEAALILGLRRTPVLGIFAGEGQTAQRTLPAFRNALTAAQVPGKFLVPRATTTGFMGPPDQKVYAHEEAEIAWVEIYEFLGKRVEDARPAVAAAGTMAAETPLATIADLMRAVNEPTGLRGTLSKSLEQEPATGKQWDRIRANAALIAESGVWLEKRTPSRGASGDWQREAKAYTAAAAAIVAAADKHDYAGARRGLQQLAMQCAACHRQHR